MSAEIPAGSVSPVRKQCVNTRLPLRGIEQIFRFAIFMSHRIVGPHRYRAERVPVGSNAVAKDGVIDTVSEDCEARHHKDCRKEATLQSRCQGILWDEHSPLSLMVTISPVVNRQRGRGRPRHTSLVVIFQPQVRDELFPFQMPQRVLQLHRLNEQIMLRIQSRGGHR